MLEKKEINEMMQLLEFDKDIIAEEFKKADTSGDGEVK